MTTRTADQSTRTGSPEKRAAILGAACDLFLRDGYDRTSMDAISALAKVSKRTVYDYYGDKRRLLIGVLETGGETLMAGLRGAVARHLTDDLADVGQLERALADFAVDMDRTVISQIAYTAVTRLVAANRDVLREHLAGHYMNDLPEELFAERMAFYAGRGLLDAPDPRLAAEHFKALTTLLAYDNEPDPAGADPERVRQVMVQGAAAFVRAYGVRA